MKKLTFVLFFSFGLLVSSFSQTKQESIRELFHLMKQDSSLIKVFQTFAPMLAQKGNQPMDSVAKAKEQESLKQAMEMVRKIVDLVTEDKVKLYDQHYTQEEINALILFYKSPVGRKYIATTPEITKDIVMKVITEYLPNMQKKEQQTGK
jgi:hypothetical protein